MFAKHVLAAALAVVLFGTARAAPVTAPLIVNADALPSYIHNNDPIILSTQSSLENGNEPGYIKGAYAVSEDLWREKSAKQEQLSDLKLWSNLIGELGIGKRDRPVIVYDNGALKFASRIRYLLNHFGVRNAILVNGGWPAIEKLIQGKWLEGQGLASLPPFQAYTAVPDNDPIPIATREQVRDVVDGHDPGVMLVDVRSEQEYDGTFIFLDLKRPGHIPGAVNLPLNDLFVDPKKPTVLLDKQGLFNVFSKYNPDLAKPMIFYCQDGARSSLGALAAVKAGYRNVRLYYLSYLNWQSFPDDPVVGPKPK